MQGEYCYVRPVLRFHHHRTLQRGQPQEQVSVYESGSFEPHSLLIHAMRHASRTTGVRTSAQRAQSRNTQPWKRQGE